MQKQFKLNDTINLPHEVSKRRVKGKNLFIAKQNPTWIVLDDEEGLILEELLKNKTLKESLYQHYNQFNSSETEKVAKNLLTKIEKNGFYEKGSFEETKNLPLFLVTTNRCNLTCRQCYVDAGKSLKNELTTDEIKELIDQFSDINNSRVILTGGEPLKRDDIFDISEYIKRRGHNLFLLTNSLLIQTREIAERIDSLFDFVQISLDGVTPEHNDFYRGKGTFYKIIDSINLFEGLNIPIKIGMMVTPKNYLDIKQNIGKFFRENIRIKNVGINFGGLLERGRGVFCEKGESEEYIEGILSSSENNGLFYEKDNPKNVRHSNCGYGEGLNIGSNGDVYLCPMIIEKFKFTNIREEGLTRIIEHLHQIQENSSVENIEECQSCDLEYFCGGTCRLKNLETNGDILRPICDNSFKNKIYEHLVKFN